jgi:hypothetical protein
MEKYMSWIHKDYRKEKRAAQPINPELTPRKAVIALDYHTEEDVLPVSWFTRDENLRDGIVDASTWDMIRRSMTRGIEVVE